METVPQTKQKLDYKKTFLIGFGFLASSALWAVYNAYVPLILNEQLRNVEFVMQRGILGVLVGFIMTIDNIFGVIFQPLFGRLSDRTHSRFGKRRIYMLVGMPISALLFILIPAAETVVTLMLCVILFNFVMSTWRSPVVALMPDLTPPALRSEGNAVINLMGGVGTFLGMVSGMFLTSVLKIEDGLMGRMIVFTFTSVVVLVSLLVVMTRVKEPDNRLRSVADRRMTEEEEARELAKKKKDEKQKFKNLRLSRDKKVSLFFMLVGLFFVFNGSETIQTYFTTFATTELNVSEFMATLLMGVFALSLMIFAVPAGKLGQKIGRKKTILIGLAGALVLFLLFFATRNIEGFIWVMIAIALIGGGACVALVNINTLPIVLEIGTEEQIGAFTGYYYTATFTASIVAPILMGAIFDVTTQPGGMGYWSLFIYSPIAFALAFLCILFVRHGEAKDPDAPAPDSEVA